jgi:uncharacterized membrane-anchored protein YhcB (DUF1043 family)
MSQTLPKQTRFGTEKEMKISKLQFLKQEVSKHAGKSMPFIDVLERIYNKTRGHRNTQALLVAARATDGLIICHTEKWATELRDTQDVRATVYTDPKIWTDKGPFLLDLPVMFEFTKAHSRMVVHANNLIEFMDQKGME